MIPGELYSLYKKQPLSYEDSARCRLGCRICSCVLVFNSLWLVCHFSLAFFPSWECEMWERTAAVSLQSFAEVTQWLLLYSEVAYQLQCWAAGKEAPENFNYGYSTCYGSSRPESFEKTWVEYKSLTSHLYLLQSFNTAFKAKIFHFTGIWSCQVWSLMFLFAYQSQNAFPASALLSLLF